MLVQSKKQEKRLGAEPETRRGGNIILDTTSPSSYDGPSTSWTSRGVEEPMTRKVHGSTKEVLQKLYSFVFIGSGPGSLSPLARQAAREREKNRRTHRSLRKKVKSKEGTDISSPPGEDAMGTNEGEDSETSIETSSLVPSAASSREISRAAFNAIKRRVSVCKSRTPAPFKTCIISMCNRGTGAGTEADTAFEISGLRHEVENLRAELNRYRHAEEDEAKMPPPLPPAEVVHREKSAVVTMVDTVTPPVTRQSAKRTASPSPSNKERNKGKRGRKVENPPPMSLLLLDRRWRPLQSFGGPYSLGRDEILRMIEESVGAALRVFSTNLEKIISKHIRRALGGLLPLLPQANHGDSGRKNAPKTVLPPSSQAKKGAECPPPARRQQVERGDASHDQTAWSKVVGWQEKPVAKKRDVAQQRASPKTPGKEQGKPKRERARRVSKISAIVVSYPQGERTIAEETGKIGLDKVSLQKDVFTVRKGATCALVIEVPGQNHANRADNLVGLMREVLRKDVKIDRSIKMADLRVWGSFREATVDAKTVVVAIAANAKCGEEVIYVGDIRQGRRGEGALSSPRFQTCRSRRKDSPALGNI
ncbi:hypothetical protein KM043_000151 [Ampulex compressa]|nr:hypothetical protein KM043_000151 [Ampulex compressa]